MEFREKEILRLRQQGIEEKYHSIYDSYVFIGRQYIEFTMQDIYPPVVRIMLPKFFMDMPSTLAKQKYPSEHRPTVIKTSPDLSINFAFQYFEKNIAEEDIPKAARYYYSMLQKCYPGYDYLDFDQCFRGDKDEVLAWYIYSNPTITDVVFNIHAFMAVEGHLLQGIFNAPEKSFYEWKPYITEIFKSVTSARDN